jgi:hypothetical protein
LLFIRVSSSSSAQPASWEESNSREMRIIIDFFRNIMSPPAGYYMFMEDKLPVHVRKV